MEHRPQQPPAQPATGITGLPASVSSTSLVALFDRGRAIGIAADNRLTVYELQLMDQGGVARERESHRLPGNAQALSESGLGLTICTEYDGRSQLAVLRGRSIVPLVTFEGIVTSLAAAGGHACAVYRAHGSGSKLVRIDLRQRQIIAERSLDHATMTVSLDPLGEHVLLTDRLAGRIVSLGADLRPLAAVAPARPSGPAPTSTHDACCCCVTCLSAPRPSDGGTKPPAGGGQDPARPGGQDPGQPAGQPGSERPGTVATPSGEGGTYVGSGGRVDKYPPPSVHRPPCGRSLFFGVAQLLRADTLVLAADRSARHVALLSSDMNLLTEWHFGRGGALLLAADSSAHVIMHARDAGTWVAYPVADLLTRVRPDLRVFPLLPDDTKTFFGQQVYALSYGQQPRPNAVKGLLIPIIEGDQTYLSSDLAGFDRFMKRAMLPVVKDFYAENSFGIVNDVTVTLFGHDPALAPGKGPLRLPRHRLADYYWPTYVPARVDLVRPAVSAGTKLVFDGRESLTLQVRPLNGGPPGKPVTLPFFALAFQRDDPHPASEVKFVGDESLTLPVTLPDGTAKVLQLQFTPRTFSYPDESSIDLNPLANYLDGVMHAAETAAGLGPVRLFAPPVATRLPRIGGGFGRLLVTFSAAVLSGNRLQIDPTTAVAPGGDPMGLFDPIIGTMDVADTSALQRLLSNATLLGQRSALIPFNDPYLNAPTAMLGGGLTTTFTISDRYGGPGADVHVVSSNELGALFALSIPSPNSATTKNDAQAVRDAGALFTDVFSAAIQALRDGGQPTDALKDFGCVMVLPLEVATPNPADPSAVLPSELWSVSPLARPFTFRGVETITTIADVKDTKIQLQSAWTLVFLKGSAPDNAMICHELGHALGFGDLYRQDGYRDELGYLGSWAIMDSHEPMSHHCGYHKLQQEWIPDGAGTETDFGRVLPLGLPNPAAAWTKEMLLVPLEVWRDSLLDSARAAFGVAPGFPVVQLGYIDFGGDGSVFGLIEARQPGAHFSGHLPDGGGILITNCIAWSRDERIVIAGRFRRSVQLLNPEDILRNPGEAFDLAFGKEFAVKGMKVELLDTKIVEGDTQVYRVKMTRENAEFADLYFERGDPYWKSPDLWVDWMGNNQRDSAGHPVFSDDPKRHDSYGLGQPVDQGEKIRVWPSGARRPDGSPKTEAHWLVARVRNRGTIKALDVKVSFYYYDPPGAGDGRKPMNILNAEQYKLINALTGEQVLGRDDPEYAPKDLLMRWDVPPGFGGHTCLYVQIEDMRVERESNGAAVGTRDLWGLNDAAQKNVDQFESLSGSPFEPIEFDFSVHNGGPTPEDAYIEPDGLPYGMTLTVSPPRQLIPAGATVIFHCTLQLDEEIIRTGCENDQRFRIHAWRQEAESAARWGGVEYEIRPRAKTTTTLTGSWDQANQITLSGKVNPAPGGGVVSLRLDFDNAQPTWVSVNATGAGAFTWTGAARAGSHALDAVAIFEGNRKFGSSPSNELRLTPYPVIH